MRTCSLLALAAVYSTAARADVLTFDDLGLPHGTVITTHYAAQGVIFSSQSGQLRLQSATTPLFPAQPIGLADTPYYTSVVIATFPAGAISAGAWIDFGFFGPGVKLEAFDGPGATGNVLATAFTSTEVLLTVGAPGIQSVRFSNAGVGKVTYLIDNFTYTLVPAPGAPAFAFAGLALGGRRRRDRT